MKNLINEITTALETLGISGSITLQPITDLDRIKVTVDGKYFGIWDAVKKTFVD